MSKQQKKRKEITINSFFPGSSQHTANEIEDQEIPANITQTLEYLKIQLTHELKIQLTQELKIQLLAHLRRPTTQKLNHIILISL